LDGLRGRPSRRTAAAAAIAIAESAVYASNNQVCPLTPLVEELGAASGSVTDIFLPDWLSRRIPPIFGTILLVGLVLNARTWWARYPRRAGGGRRTLAVGGGDRLPRSVGGDRHGPQA
jgi:hypothetical protein